MFISINKNWKINQKYFNDFAYDKFAWLTARTQERLGSKLT